jgi:stage V sporulation protein AF
LRPRSGNWGTSAVGEGSGQNRGRSLVREAVSPRLEENRRRVRERLGYGVTYDVLVKDLEIGGREAFLLGIDGFVDTQVMNQVAMFLLSTEREEIAPLSAGRVERRRLGFIETERTPDFDRAVELVLAGQIALFVEGLEEAILIDARSYPERQVGEPAQEKVVRGPRDGFVETLVRNTALLRRRLRDPSFRAEIFPIGRRSRTDVALVYLADLASPRILENVRQRLHRIEVDGLPMAEKSLEEFLTAERKWWNPFPVVRYTERPDVAAVHLLEGHVVILVDTSPVAMILPASFFHHIQHAEEFHQDVAVGVLFRLARYLALLLAWVGTPLWLALALGREALPEPWRVIGPKQPSTVPLMGQFLIGEGVVELIRMALIHTPTGLTTAMGVIGAVLLGQLAVQVGLFNAEAVLYVTLSALGFFAIPSPEMASAIRLCRLVYLVAAGVGGFTGLGAAFLLTLLLLLLTDSFGLPYLWPLWPPHLPALAHVLFRQPVPAVKRRLPFFRQKDPTRISRD